MSPSRAKPGNARKAKHVGARAVLAQPLTRAAPVFAALGDEIRLGLVTRLCVDGPSSIARLTSGAGVTRQAITKHLHVLADAGLVSGTRSGRAHVWQLESARLDEARHWLAEIENQWDEALGRLKTALENES